MSDAVVHELCEEINFYDNFYAPQSNLSIALNRALKA